MIRKIDGKTYECNEFGFMIREIQEPKPFIKKVKK
jgi:hypothetical protein